MHPDLSYPLTFEDGYITSLVIEHQDFFRRFLEDLVLQIDGYDGDAVLSKNNTPISFSNFATVISSFIPFEINQKPLLTKLVASLEKTALDETHYLASMELLQHIESYFEGLFYEYPCDMGCTKLSLSSLIRSVGIEFNGEYTHPIEKILDYMELVREFEKRDKLFIFVNMRSYFSTSTMESFLATALSHGHRILLLDGWSHSKLSCEQRLTIDTDLCEI